MKRAFTLIELLVVIAVIALLMGILLPVMGRVRIQAKVVAVNSDLNQIGLALEMYMMDNDGNVPPTRVNCMMKENYYQLPAELAKGHYLPRPAENEGWLGVDMEDRFNRGFSYKYTAAGDLVVNLYTTIKNRIWVPDGFPAKDSVEKGRYYRGIHKSPVTWVVYSTGPDFDKYKMKKMHYPVPVKTWYDPAKRKGVIVRMRLKKGKHIGSFQPIEPMIDADAETGL